MRRFLTIFSVIIFAFLPGISVFAQGGGPSTGAVTNLSLPGGVSPETQFNISFRITNTTNENSNTAMHIPLKLSQCNVYSSKASNPNQNSNNIQVDGASSVVYNGTTYSIIPQQGSLGGIPTVIPNPDLTLGSGDSVVITLAAKAINVIPGDQLHTSVSCTLNGTGPNPFGGDDFGTAPSSIRTTLSITGDSQLNIPNDEDSEDDSSDEDNTKLELPSEFTKSSSDSTDLTSLDEDELKSVSNFKLDVPDIGSIQFNEDIDFTDEELVEKLPDLDEYIQIGKGYVDVDSTAVSEFDLDATVELKGMKLVDGKYEILRNGDIAGGYAENYRYDSDTGILMFDVNGFSRYEVSPSLLIDAAKNDDKMIIKGSVGDLDTVVTILVDDEEIQSSLTLDEEGDFEVEITLFEEDEEIRITATGSSGVIQNELIRIDDYDTSSNETSSRTTILIIGSIVLIAVIATFIYIEISRRKKNSETKKKLTKDNPAKGSESIADKFKKETPSK
jgi:hypothetical protein